MAALSICYVRAGSLVAAVEATIGGVGATVGGEADIGRWLERARPTMAVCR